MVYCRYFFFQPSVSLAGEGNWGGDIGYYCPPFTESVPENDFVTFTGGLCNYVLNGGSILTSGTKFGDGFIGVVGSSTQLNGHSLGVACNDGVCDSSQPNDNWHLENLQNGDNFFIAVYQSSDGITEFRDYFLGNSESPPSSNYGVFNMIWGIDETDGVVSLDSPIGATTTPTTSVTFNGTYFLAEQTADFPLNSVLIEITNETNGFSKEFFVLNVSVTATTTEQFATTTTLLTNNAYSWRARLVNNDVLDNPFVGAFTTYTESERFFVVSNPYLESAGVDFFDAGFAFNLATTTCSITNIAGCFQNALIFAFVPNKNVFDNFISLKEELQNKPPFGYIVLLTSALQNISATTTPAFALVSENNITDNIFTPLKNGLTWVLWLFFGIWLYKRVRNMNI